MYCEKNADVYKENEKELLAELLFSSHLYFIALGSIGTISYFIICPWDKYQKMQNEVFQLYHFL